MVERCEGIPLGDADVTICFFMSTQSEAGLAVIYEIINPSDTYTIQSPDFYGAAVAVLLLGQGAYGIEGTPVMFGWDDWLMEQKIDLDTFIAAHREAIAVALESILIGDKYDREEVEEILRLMPEDQREAWLAKRHDKKRSSMNDIGSRAQQLAKSLRGTSNHEHDQLNPTENFQHERNT